MKHTIPAGTTNHDGYETNRAVKLSRYQQFVKLCYRLHSPFTLTDGRHGRQSFTKNYIMVCGRCKGSEGLDAARADP